MDLKILIGIALIILAFFSPVIAIVIFDEPETDYEDCIHKCPSNFNGKFKDLECPKMCEKLKEEVKEKAWWDSTWMKKEFIQNSSGNYILYSDDYGNTRLKEAKTEP